MRIWLAALFVTLSTPVLAESMTVVPTAPAQKFMCPAEAKSCKVLVLTDEQIKTVEALIENTCMSGPYAQIRSVIEFYQKMLAQAPAGDVPEVKK